MELGEEAVGRRKPHCHFRWKQRLWIWQHITDLNGFSRGIIIVRKTKGGNQHPGATVKIDYGCHDAIQVGVVLQGCGVP
jgi:hypothetical protein